MKNPKLVKVISRFDRIAFVHRMPAIDVVAQFAVSVYDHEGLKRVMAGKVHDQKQAIAYAKTGLEF